jgi:glycolate oxidase FAD binding subunit
LHPQTCYIDAQGPYPVVRPGSVPELTETVRRAAAEGQALYPVGGQTQLTLGLPPSRLGIAVDMTALQEVIDFPARDMTITVQAGITLARLDEIVRAERLRLPIDVPASDKATLGGMLAANVSGPRRYGYGTPRDYVIGITTINDEGQETKAGGRVVKNVAGYDLCKLHIGALGTLGIISQVTLKLRPLAEETALVVVRCDLPEVEGLLDVLHGSATRPVCIEVLSPAVAGEMPPNRAKAWTLVVGYEESGEAVRWQVQQLLRELAAQRTHGIDTLVSTTAEPVWGFLTECQRRPDAALTFKANLLPHAVAGFLGKAEQRDGSLRLHAHAGNGVVYGHLDGSPSLDQVKSLLDALAGEAENAKGNLVVRQCSPAWKKELPVWGSPRGDLALMRAVRDKLDPRRLFNPGRFLS